MSQDTQVEKAITQDAYPTSVQPLQTVSQTVVSTPPGKKFFPYKEHEDRLKDYEYYNRLFMGNHFEAFNVRIADERYTKEYSKLRYVMANYAGLISKIIADLLFSEAPDFNAGEEGDQEFIDALVEENDLHTQNYESALSNSALGDGLYRVRIGKRYPEDVESTVIIEDVNPAIYFPEVDGFNPRAEPSAQKLAWTYKLNDRTYLREEIHHAGYLENHVYLMEGNEIKGEIPLDASGIPDLQPIQPTGINRSLLIHVPNWKTGNRYFGISDYFDLDKLFYAINNRMTKVDNILDKHSDPILMVPPGVLDEKGNVNKKALGVIEVQEGENSKPEYIVWDASLDNAFKEIEKIVEMMFMMSETSPDILGMGQGQSDSGRALKLKIMRTLAKAARKKLYYDRALKETLYVAQLMAKQWNLQVGGLKLSKDPIAPEIEWYDGLPIDNAEQVDVEAKRLDSGTTTTADSIMRLDGVSEEEAKKKAAEIQKETAIAMPTSKLSTPFGPNANGQPANKQTQTPPAGK